jgi:hypothetical protein
MCKAIGMRSIDIVSACFAHMTVVSVDCKTTAVAISIQSTA